MSNLETTPIGFESLKLHPAISKALNSLSFTSPTPIQIQAIPAGIEGKSIVGCAQTGTGKTAAFCIPILSRLLEEPKGRTTALILAPTRELALQIDTFWQTLIRFAPDMGSACLIGGDPMFKQLKALRRSPRLIIATPGRLCDHLERNTVQLERTQVLVLDEADRMLDMGFYPQLKEIRSRIPNAVQSLLFTATWDQSDRRMQTLAKSFMQDPVFISVGNPNKSTAQVEHSIIHTTHHDKNNTLLEEVNQREGSILIFAKTQHGTDRLAKFLDTAGLAVNSIHAGRSQAQRNAALRGFRKGEIRILVATDVAARGIDVLDIGHVINFDLPQCNDDYVHRIGRTGRAGKLGHAVSLITPNDRGQWSRIARTIQTTVAEKKAAVTERPAKSPEERSAERGRDRGYGRREPRNDARNDPRNDRRRGYENRNYEKRTFERPSRPRRERTFDSPSPFNLGHQSHESKTERGGFFRENGPFDSRPARNEYSRNDNRRSDRPFGGGFRRDDSRRPMRGQVRDRLYKESGPSRSNRRDGNRPPFRSAPKTN
jgi:ATP-dependent RNA helicase DeaD